MLTSGQLGPAKTNDPNANLAGVTAFVSYSMSPQSFTTAFGDVEFGCDYKTDTDVSRGQATSHYP